MSSILKIIARSVLTPILQRYRIRAARVIFNLRQIWGYFTIVAELIGLQLVQEPTFEQELRQLEEQEFYEDYRHLINQQRIRLWREEVAEQTANLPDDRDNDQLAGFNPQ